jgi:hypothetical protein
MARRYRMMTFMNMFKEGIKGSDQSGEFRYYAVVELQALTPCKKSNKLTSAC